MKLWWAKFTRQLEEVDRALRRPPPLPKPDPDLHASIMRAVRAAARAETRAAAPERPYGRWMMASATALALAAVAVLVAVREGPEMLRPAPAVSSSSREIAQAPGAAFDLGAKMPAMVMAPLSNELARVDQDIQRTTQMLLASFP